jgi:hypothetical protein
MAAQLRSPRGLTALAPVRDEEEGTMFMLRHRIHATLGQEAEVRAFMSDWVRHAQEEGESVALAQRIFSSEGSVLVVARRYEDLEALDERRRAHQADADWQARVARLGTMIREPVRQTLEENLVPPIAGTAPIGVVLRAFFQPAAAKIGQVRSTLEEHVRDEQAAGRGQIGLFQHIFSEAGATFTVTATHADLAELARVRQERAAAIQAITAAVGEMSRAPVAVRLLEVVVPFPR